MLHGNRTYLLQDENGQIIETHSISAGLDYPGVGPEHAYLKDIGRAEYVGVTDDEALAAFHRLLPQRRHHPGARIEPRRRLCDEARADAAKDKHLLVNLSGRGDKDIATVAERLDAEGAAMSRIDATFAALAERGRKALIPYITAGDPHADTTAEIMRAMVEAGADVIELGVPFSDPMADGPVIQKASERALARGIGLPQVLAMVREFRGRDARDAGRPHGLRESDRALRRRALRRRRAGSRRRRRAGRRLSARGVRRVRRAAAKARGIDPIFLLAPTSTDARIASVAEAARGYVYHVSLKGVTGAGHFDIDAVADMMPRIKAHVKLPVGVGFGIRDAATARAVADVADAVVIGSALVQLLEGAGSATRRRASPARFIAGIRAALDA